MTTAVSTQQVAMSPAEMAAMGGDLSQLDEGGRASVIQAICASLGLNPITRPLEYLWLGKGNQKKLVLYMRKDGTEQLRKIHGVSLQIVSRGEHDDIYEVVTRATMPDGRTDEEIGATPLLVEEIDWQEGRDGKRRPVGTGKFAKLSGEDLANAIMKTVTKSKRRATLSICGLGFLDESEIDSIPDAERYATRVAPINPHNANLSTGEIPARQLAAGRPAPQPQAPPVEQPRLCTPQQIEQYNALRSSWLAMDPQHSAKPANPQATAEQMAAGIAVLSTRIDRYEQAAPVVELPPTAQLVTVGAPEDESADLPF